MIGSHKRHWLMLLACVSVLWLALPAFAAPAAPPANAGSCSQYVGLTNRIASCLRAQVDAAAVQFFAQFYDFLKEPIAALATLAVIIYGILMAYGLVERVGRDTAILMFKLAVVFGFVGNSQLLYNNVTQMMDATAATVVMFTPPSGTALKGQNGDVDFSQSQCLQNLVKEQTNAGGASGNVTGPWLGIDCLLDTVIGIKMPTNNNNGVNWYNDKFGSEDSLSRGYLFLFFSGAQSSILGVVFAVIGFAFIMGLLMMIIKAFFTYIGGYMGVAFMIVVSPLFIPLILTSKTQEYFNKWLKVTISFAIQPIVMLVFVSFSLAAVDFAAFSGDYSIMYKIAGDASRQNGFDFNKYMTEPRDPNTGAVSTGTDAKPILEKKDRTVTEVKAATTQALEVLERDAGGAFNKLARSKCTAENIKADPTLEEKCRSYPIAMSYTGINWDMMAKARTPAVQVTAGGTAKQQIANEVLAASLFCAIVVFIMNGLLKIVPFIAYDLMGDAMQTPNIGKLMSKLDKKGE